MKTLSIIFLAVLSMGIMSCSTYVAEVKISSTEVEAALNSLDSYFRQTSCTGFTDFVINPSTDKKIGGITWYPNFANYSSVVVIDNYRMDYWGDIHMYGQLKGQKLENGSWQWQAIGDRKIAEEIISMSIEKIEKYVVNN